MTWSACPGIRPFTYVAKGLIVIGTRYSGEAGARRFREQGYAPEMIEMMKGAGVRTFKTPRRYADPRHDGEACQYQVQQLRVAVVG
jgi:hypothetical protein